MFHSRQHETVWTNVAPFQNSTACKRFAATAPSPRWCSCLWLSPHVAHGVRRVFARAFVSVICFGFAHDRVWTTTQRFYSFCLGKLVSRSLRKYPDLEQHLVTCFVRLEFVFDPSLSLSLFLLSQGNGKSDEPCAGRDCRSGCKCLPEKGSRVSQCTSSDWWWQCWRSEQYVSSLMVQSSSGCCRFHHVTVVLI